MKRNKVKKIVLQMVEKVARNELEVNVYDWPPYCLSILHQPKRPKRKTDH